MNIINKSKLYGFRNSTRTFSRAVIESLEAFSKEERIGKSTVFLSHKHDELKELDSANSLLKKLGVNVYGDVLDIEMPKSTSRKTAQRIKKVYSTSNRRSN